jgi:hypothetical protein
MRAKTNQEKEKQENYNFSLVKGKEFLLVFFFLDLLPRRSRGNPKGWLRYMHLVVHLVSIQFYI